MIVYDIETLRGPEEVEDGWENPEGMGFGTAVSYCYVRNRYFLFGTEEKHILIAQLKMTDKVISFNGVRFDNKVLLGNDYKESPWEDHDLLLEAVWAKFQCATVKEAEEKHGSKLVHNDTIGLDALAYGTLGMGKTGKGAHAPVLIKKGKWAEVFAYNLHDVRLTKMLYDFSQEYGYLIDRQGNKLTFG